MKTNKTVHLGDGTYAGLDTSNSLQFWLGTNHHEHMTVALGPRELARLLHWLRVNAPHIAEEAGLL